VRGVFGATDVIPGEMTMLRMAVLGFLLVGVGVLVWTAVAQQTPTTQPSPAEMKKQFAVAAEKESAPTEKHKLLGALVGQFDQLVEVSLAPKPMKYHCLAKSDWIMGRRYVKVESASAPDEEVKGDRLTIYGYDTGKGKFTLWGIDSMSTFAVSAQGDYDPATKTFTFAGEREQPGMSKIPFRWIVRLQGEGRLVQEIQLKPPGMDEFITTVSVKYTPKSK
jgi:hypothetical protein